MCYVSFFSYNVTDRIEIKREKESISHSLVFVCSFKNIPSSIYLAPSVCVYTVHLFVMRRFRFASMNNRFFMSLFPLIIHAIYIHVSYTREC